MNSPWFPDTLPFPFLPPFEGERWQLSVPDIFALWGVEELDALKNVAPRCFAGFVCLKPDHLGPVAVECVADKIPLRRGFQVHVSPFRQTSHGWLVPNRANPGQAPRIAVDFAPTEHDRREMVEGVKAARHIIDQPAFAPDQGAAVSLDANNRWDADTLDHARTPSETGLHPSCTCRIGHDAMAVTGPDLRAHGVEGLRGE